MSDSRILLLFAMLIILLHELKDCTGPFQWERDPQRERGTVLTDDGYRERQ